MSKNINTDIGFFLKIACLFIILGLGFINPKHYLNQTQEAVKQISMVQKPITFHPINVIK